jgi:hypothetical protein
MDIKVGFNNMKVSIVHHRGDVEFCTCGCEVVCANPRHGLEIGPTMPCQVTKHMYQTNSDLLSNLLCPKKIGQNWFRLLYYGSLCTMWHQMTTCV